jgi:hypothetical protein
LLQRNLVLQRWIHRQRPRPSEKPPDKERRRGWINKTILPRGATQDGGFAAGRIQRNLALWY